MKVHLIPVGLSAFLSVAPRAASAEEAVRHPSGLTLERARALAAERAPSILAARARVSVAEGSLAGASVLVPFNPQLSGRAGPRFGPEGTTVDAAASLTQRVEIGGQRSARIAGAAAEVDSAEAAVRDELRRILFDVSVTFARILYAEATHRIRTESASVARALLESVERRHEVGEIGGLDVNVAAVAFARAVAERERAAAQRAVAAGRMRGLLGLDPGAPIELEGTLDRLPRYTLGRLMAQLGSRADLERLRAEARAADAESSLGRSEAWPDVGLFAQYGREEGHDIVGGGLSVFLPIFDHGQAARARGTARRRAAVVELEATQRMAGAELAAVVEGYRHLKAAVRAYETRALPGLVENLERGRKAYQAGAIPIGELLSIQRELVAGRTSYLDLLLEANLTAFEIEALAGVLP